MNSASFIVLLVIFGVFQTIFARPVEESKDTKNASVYIIGNIQNAAISQDFSKSQAASDRKESEWNSTSIQNSKNQSKFKEDQDLLTASHVMDDPDIGRMEKYLRK